MKYKITSALKHTMLTITSHIRIFYVTIMNVWNYS